MLSKEKPGLGILLKWASVLSIVPHHAYLAVDVRCISKFTACIFLGACLSLVFANVICHYPHMKEMDLWMDTLTTSMKIVLACVLVVRPMSCSQAWQNFFNSLQEVSNNLGSNKKCLHITSKQVIFELSVLHMIIPRNTLKYCLHLAFKDIDNPTQHLFSAYQDVIDYYSGICAILVMHLVLIINHNFKDLNEQLRVSAPWSVNEKVEIVCMLSEIHSNGNLLVIQYGIRKMQKNYRDLAKLVEMLNEIFGYQILFLIGNAILVFLGALKIGLVNSSVTEIVFSSLEVLYVMVSQKKYIHDISNCLAKRTYTELNSI